MGVELKNPKGVALPVAFYRHLAVLEASSRVLVMAGQLGQSLDGAFPESVEARMSLHRIVGPVLFPVHFLQFGPLALTTPG